MEINCTGILFWGGLICVLISFFAKNENESFWRWIGGICLIIWAVMQVCGIIWAISLWNSYDSRFQEAPDADICPSGILTYKDGGWVCSNPPTPVTVRIESSWQFFDLATAEDMIHLAYEDVAYSKSTPITVYCTNDARYWRSTLDEFSQELNKEAPFGVPNFCPEGGYFEVAQ